MKRHIGKTARFFAVLLAFVFAFTLFAPAAYAAEGATGTTADGFVWEELSGGKIEITNYTGAGGTIGIPASVNGLPVKSIRFGAFQFNTTILSVDIPASVASIGDSAFEFCSSLSSVTLHNGLLTIGAAAFYDTPLTGGITIPASVTSIGNDAFSWCETLSSVTLPEGLKTIGEGAFYYTGLSAVTIPAGVTSIGLSTFHNCKSLVSVTLPEGLETIGDFAFYNTALTAVTIPASVTSIGKSAFGKCTKLTSVTLPEGLLTIGDYAFYETALTAVTIPAGVTSIGRNAFYDCGHLTRAVIYSRTAAFGNNVFDSTGIGSGGIYCLSGSTAQAYASAGPIPFHLLYMVAFDTDGGALIPDAYIPDGDTMSAPAAPVWSGHVFGGWYLDAGLTESAAFPLAVSADATLHAKWTVPTPTPHVRRTALTLTLSPADGRIYTGELVTITPSVPGGAWSFDASQLSCDGNTFKGLRAGAARVTYTVDGKSVFADITVGALHVPSTGQDGTPIWILSGAALAFASAMVTLRRIKRKGNS